MDQTNQLHEKSIIIDATCPLAIEADYWQNWKQGGVTAIAPTVGGPIGNTAETLQRLCNWLVKMSRNRDQMLLVTSVDDIYKAKEEQKLGIILHFQGTGPFEANVNNIEMFYALGLRMVQLTYNVQDRVGTGCAEGTDSGLSEFGKNVISELDRLGIVVDCAHTGLQTTRDAIDASKNPVIISHANARGVCDNNRNLPDDIIKAIAGSGGVMGLNGFPSFVAHKDIWPVTLDMLIDHAEYIVNLVGVDHVSVGIDYFQYQSGVVSDEVAVRSYNEIVEKGVWKPSEYDPPPYVYPEGIEMPEKLGNLTAGLLKRGFSDDDVKKILGLNLMRVFKAVWK